MPMWPDTEKMMIACVPTWKPSGLAEALTDTERGIPVSTTGN